MKRIIQTLVLAGILLSNTVFTHAQVASFTIGGSNGYCMGATINFTNNSTGATDYFWDFGDGITSTLTTPTHAYNSPGTYMITLTAINGVQTHAVTKAVYVRNLPNAYFYMGSFGASFITPGAMIYLTNASTASTSYFWNNGNGKTATTEKFSFSYPNPGTYTISLKTTNGCGDSSYVDAQLEVIDSNSFIPISSGYVYPQIACPGSEIRMYSYSDVYTRMRWELGDGTIIEGQNELEHTYNIKGTYTIKLIVFFKNNSDTSLFTVKITDTEMDNSSISVNINPNSYDPNIGGYRYLTCPGSLFHFNGSYNEQIISHKWKLPGGIVLSAMDTFYSFATIGDYPLVYEYENACGIKDSLSFMLNVRATDSIPANYSYINVQTGPDGSICPGNKVLLSTFSFDTEADSTKWIFHDGSSVLNENFVEKLYPNTGNFPLKYIFYTRCRIDTTSLNIEVKNNSQSFAGFDIESSWSAGIPVCYGDSIFGIADSNYYTAYKVVTVTQHKWEMGDGTTYTTPKIQHKYNNPGYYTVLHSTVNSCGQTATEAQTIWASATASPTADFYIDQNLACVNDSILIDQFSFKTDSVVIFMGDGNKIIQTRKDFFPHTWYVYKTAGNYNVMLVAYNKCSSDTAYDQITVFAAPAGQIQTNDTTITKGTSLTFTANLTGTYFHVWFYGTGPNDTSTATTLTRTFNTVGTYYIYFGAENGNGCKSWDSVKVTVVLPGALSEQNQNGPDAYVYPNPVKDRIQIQLISDKEDQLIVNLIDITGKTLYSKKMQLSNGNNALEFDATIIPAGVYFVNLQTAAGSKTFKLIKH
ncbi:MAG: PKD domain-containing protein [Bacteroidia bacterium]|jgi:PKD repeat protein